MNRSYGSRPGYAPKQCIVRYAHGGTGRSKYRFEPPVWIDTLVCLRLSQTFLLDLFHAVFSSPAKSTRRSVLGKARCPRACVEEAPKMHARGPVRCGSAELSAKSGA